MKKIAVLGATGSIGKQALDVARGFKDEIEIVGISGHNDLAGLTGAANEFLPICIALTGGGNIEKLGAALTYKPQVFAGKNALITLLEHTAPDLVVHAVSGIAGLEAFYWCLENGVDVALANKEALVCGAGVTRALMDSSAAQVIPVDSEHSAIFQCLGDSYDITGVRTIWLTASGGPFLGETAKFIYNAPLERALRHPNWSMGAKITIDSASLANKGLEVIEAHYMYKAPVDMISVAVHPQSIVHSMVEFEDSSVLAQLGPTDMRLPLQKAMLFPKMRKFFENKRLDFYALSKLEFLKPDGERFPCLPLAFEAIGKDATAAYSIADEVAVALYVRGKIAFGRICEVIERAVARFSGQAPTDMKGIFALDKEVRAYLKETFGG